MATHYDTLGLRPDASPSEIKSAYRKLARELHPDVNDNPGAKEAFQKLQLSYEVLSDPRRKRAYDDIIKAPSSASTQVGAGVASRGMTRAEKDRLEAEELRLKAEERMRDAPAAPKVDRDETERLKHLMTVGRLIEAEKQALAMVAREPRQPVPQAILGDLMRMRGEREKALSYYALAAQFEPKNPIYQRKYEETMAGHVGRVTSGPSYAPEVKFQPLAVGAFLIILMAVYTVFAKERPLGVPLASLLTLGNLTMLTLSGVVTGSCLVLSESLDSFQFATGSTVSKVTPITVMGLLGFALFWLATLAYFIYGQSQQAFNRSLSLFTASIVGCTLVFVLAAWSKSGELAAQVLLAGPNFVYMGALLGWLVTDSLGRSSRV